jgi:hypothetical protein
MRLTFRAALACTVVLTFALTLTAAAPSSATPHLASELLSVTQMPKGWSVQSPSGNVNAGCLTNVVGLSNFLEAKGVTQTARAKIFIEDNESVPMVAEMLATYSDPIAAYTKIVGTLAICKRVNGQIFGVNVTGTMKKWTFAHFASSSAAFVAHTSIMGTTFDEDVIIMRKGNVVMGIIEGGLPLVNARQFQGFVVKALAKVP